MIGGSIRSLKIMLLTAVLVFILTFNGLNINGMPFIILGALIYLSGMKSLGRFGNANIELQKGHELVDTGLFKHIRHPMYLGLLIAGFGLALLSNSLVSLLFMAFVGLPYTYLRALVEEDFLSNNLKGYAEYKQRTKMFIPRIL